MTKNNELLFAEMKFFENKKLLRKKFGIHSEIIRPYFNEIVSYTPSREREIFDKLRGTTIRYTTNENMCDADGYTERMNVGKHYANGVVLSNSDYIDNALYNRKGEWLRDRTEDEIVGEACERYFGENTQNHDGLLNRILKKLQHNKLNIQDELNTVATYAKDSHRLTAVHELNHCMAHKKVFFVPKGAEIKTFADVCRLAVKPDKKNKKNFDIVFTYGEANVTVYEFGKNGKLSPKARPFASVLKEEAIVEDWAREITAKLGLMQMSLNEYDKAQTFAEYRPFNYIVGMWNMISNNELRKRFLGGVVNDRATDEFNKKFDKLLLSCVDNDYLMKTEDYLIDSSEFNPQVIGENLREVVEFVDRHKQNANLTAEQQAFYDYCRTETLNPQHICDYMAEYVDFDDERTERAFVHELGKCYKQIGRQEVMTR